MGQECSRCSDVLECNNEVKGTLNSSQLINRQAFLNASSNQQDNNYVPNFVPDGPLVPNSHRASGGQTSSRQQSNRMHHHVELHKNSYQAIDCAVNLDSGNQLLNKLSQGILLGYKSKLVD